MNRTTKNPTLFELWQRYCELFVTQPVPSIWFDPQPNRRVRRNARRVAGVSGPSRSLSRMATQMEA